MSKRIPDKAEVVLEYPDKFYIGTFERTARYDAHFEQNGVSLTLHRTSGGEGQKSVHIHLHHALFADILQELAKTTSALAPDDAVHRNELREAAKALCRALDSDARPSKAKRKDVNDLSQLTPEEEVALLHVLE
jgi:hypothetical protein